MMARVGVRSQERCKCRRLELGEAQRIIKEGIDNRVVTAEPIERSSRWIEIEVQEVAYCRCGSGQAREPIQHAGSGKNEPIDVPAVVERKLLRSK
jgi:hypothetical protein